MVGGQNAGLARYLTSPPPPLHTTVILIMTHLTTTMLIMTPLTTSYIASILLINTPYSLASYINPHFPVMSPALTPLFYFPLFPSSS